MKSRCGILKASRKRQCRASSIIGLRDVTASISTSAGVSVLPSKAAFATMNNTMQKDKDVTVRSIVLELPNRRNGPSRTERVCAERAESQGRL